MEDPDLARYAAELARIGRTDLARKIQILRILYFDFELMPWQIRDLTGVAESTTLLRCRDDPRYADQADRNRRRKRNARFEHWARVAAEHGLLHSTPPPDSSASR